MKLLDIGRIETIADDEVTLLKKLNHVHILKYYEDFIYSGFHCIVTEYCDAGDLKIFLESSWNKSNTECQQKFLNANMRFEWSKELFEGLAYMHYEKVAHRDLTPYNVYLFHNKSKNNQLSIKIGDLGCGKEKFASDFKSYVGTLYYQSPEILRNKCYSHKTDVW